MSRFQFGPTYSEVEEDLSISEERKTALLGKCEELNQGSKNAYEIFSTVQRIANNYARTEQEHIFVMSHLGYILFDIEKMNPHGST